MRNHHIIFAAILGFITLGASPYPSPRPADIRAKAAARPATFPGSVNQSDRGCARGRDVRSSDLCAQWKAADAAAEAARWSWWQMVVGILGVVVGAATVGAAVAAALYAKKAAEEATRSATVASDAHEAFIASERAIIRVSRAYLYFAFEDLRVTSPYAIRLDVNNLGRAATVITSVSWEVSEAPIFPERLNYEQFRTEYVGAGVENNEVRPLQSEDPGDGPVWIMGYLEYSSIGRTFRTYFSFQGTYHEIDAAGEGGWRLAEAACQNLPVST